MSTKRDPAQPTGADAPADERPASATGAGEGAAAELPDPASFLSGESGTVGGRRHAVTRTAGDWARDGAAAAALTGRRLDRLAAAQASRRVLVLSIYRPGSLLPAAVERLRSERHEVRLALGATAEPDPALAADTALSGLAAGKFENLNRLLAAADTDDYDWLVVCDDDVELAPRFLDRFVALCERLELDVAQPAQTMRSHAAWRVTRRRPLALARRTEYVEIGPVTAFARRAAAELTPFPELRFGWGLDNHWGALARQRGWRMGIVDALPVRHERQRVASGYTHAEATEEGRRFLAGRPYVRTEEAQRTLATHYRVPPGSATSPAGRPSDSGGPAPDGERQRVLVVPKWYPWPEQPVLGQFCREHARALASGHDVVVLASLATPRPGFAAYRLEDVVEDGIRTLRVRYRRPFARPAAMGFQLLGMLAALRRLRAEGWRPDVVHAHVYQAAPPALALGRLSRAPVVVTEHYTGFERGTVTGYDRLLARASFEHADLVAPVSVELAGRLRALAPRARFEVVPNVVDTDAFRPSSAADAGDPRPRLLTVGALATKKGHRFLLEALGELGDAHLDIVGDGELRGELERRARELGLDGRVRFHGALAKADVAELMRRADVLVLPSLAENLPVVLIEAQASGLPAVATRVGGVPELVDEAAGALVEPGDPAALAAAIRATLARAGDFDRKRLAARARERFGYEAICSRWSELYAGLRSSSVGSTRSATSARAAASE